ncbi:MAG: ribosome biogenesis GTPase Der [Flavobacteriaceae bacterium]
MRNLVAIVGKPNVGKSTLFNRLVQKREAIVDPTSGVTRDRHYGKSDWNGREFTVIDTGGYVVGGDDAYEKEIDQQVLIAIEESDAIIFLVDVEEGVNVMDEEVARLIRRSNKPVFLVVNKVDSALRIPASTEFYSLGMDNLFHISAINGGGTGEVLDALVDALPDNDIDYPEDLPRFTVVGRPNAGKSSFVNALTGEPRNIVKDEAGTTRDSIDTVYNRFGFDFCLVDTAGIRRKAKVKANIEFYSVMRALRSLEFSDVCMLVFDATRSFDSQVKNIFWLAARNHKGIVILVNKWDLVDKDTQSTKAVTQQIQKEIAPFVDVPIIFISSLTKQRVYKAIETAVDVYKRRAQRIPTRKLNDFILPVIQKNPPPALKGKYVKIKFVTQLHAPHPQFAFFCNLPQYVKEPYKRFLENKLRAEYDFTGVTIDIFIRKK